MARNEQPVTCDICRAAIAPGQGIDECDDLGTVWWVCQPCFDRTWDDDDPPAGAGLDERQLPLVGEGG